MQVWVRYPDSIHASNVVTSINIGTTPGDYCYATISHVHPDTIIVEIDDDRFRQHFGHLPTLHDIRSTWNSVVECDCCERHCYVPMLPWLRERWERQAEQILADRRKNFRIIHRAA